MVQVINEKSLDDLFANNSPNCNTCYASHWGATRKSLRTICDYDKNNPRFITNRNFTPNDCPRVKK